MNKQLLKKEGEKWVQDGIITEGQLEQILSRYEKQDKSYILILFAVLFMSIGIIIFAFSDWTQVPAMFRVILMIISMTLLYLIGHRQYDITENTKQKISNMYGVSFILLGYMFFGATLLLIINVYDITLFNIWPLIIWSFVGLVLYAIYEHPYILVVGLFITIFSQLYSLLAYSSFDYIIFLLFLFGYFHFVFHHERKLFSYLFAIGLSLQIVLLTMVEFDQYYWFFILIMAMYLLAQIILKPTLKKALFYLSIWTVLIFRMYESFMLQDEYFFEQMEVQSLFFVVWIVAFLLLLGVKWFQRQKLEFIDVILFLPYFFLPYNYLFVIVTMFIFAIYWLIVGFQRNLDDKILIGIVSFIISTFTAYVQFAWETLNRSLFFLIGGVILFIISFLLERKRRAITPSKKGEDHR